MALAVRGREYGPGAPDQVRGEGGLGYWASTQSSNSGLPGWYLEWYLGSINLGRVHWGGRESDSRAAQVTARAVIGMAHVEISVSTYLPRRQCQTATATEPHSRREEHDL